MDNVMMGIRDICGTWYEDGNAENNTLTLYSNGDWEYTAPDGTVTADGTFTIISGDPSDIAVELTADNIAAAVYLKHCSPVNLTKAPWMYPCLSTACATQE